MAFKKKVIQLPPRLWMITGHSGDGKTDFTVQMNAPILSIDADNKLSGALRYAAGDVYEFGENHADALDVDRICLILNDEMPRNQKSEDQSERIRTIVLDSITPILEPIIMSAMETAKTSKNKIAPFKEKADAIKKLTHALHKWGCDVLWVYHIEDGVDSSGNKAKRTSIPATELARIAKAVNMRLSIVRDGDRRGVRIDYAQHGQYGMTLWDEVGNWRGMPERIEQVVYANGILAKPADPTGFNSQTEAIAWGFTQDCFNDAVHASHAYDKLKSDQNPTSAAEMWTLWIADVKQRVANKAAGKITEDDLTQEPAPKPTPEPTSPPATPTPELVTA